MTINDLGNKLKTMYEEALDGEQVVNIHLFGIKYGEIIKENKYTASKIVKASGLRKSYGTEVSKGVKLSKYVKLK